MVPHETRSGLDTRLDAVGHAVRREVLFELRRGVREGAVGVSVASLSGTDDAPGLALSHRHLPKLAEYGFVVVAGDAVEPGPRFDELTPLLEFLANEGGATGDTDAVSPRD
jgi:hypothetical protein